MDDAPMLFTPAGKKDTTARHVLQVLAEHADAAGTNTYPSVLRIEFRSGYDERTIRRALQRLDEAGLIARDGTHNECTRWKLSMSMIRPESDWDELVAAREKAKQGDTLYRQHRRARLSGTQTPGQATTLDNGDQASIRDANSRIPVRRMPESGTQTPVVRDAEPPEPPENHQEPPGVGGTLPPGPPANQEPPTSALGTDQPLPDHADGPGANPSPKGDPPHAGAREAAPAGELTDEEIVRLVHEVERSQPDLHRRLWDQAKTELGTPTALDYWTDVARRAFELYVAGNEVISDAS